MTREPHSQFHTGAVLSITVGHFLHDVFASFVAPLLPVIIQRLNLSLVEAGSLAALQQFPSFINPVLGAAADRVDLRRLMLLAPTVTAVTMSLIGLVPNYATLGVLLFVAGLSTAVWHVPSPAMIARQSGRRVGQGMSFFMVGGELAYTLGPLLIVAVVSWWGLEYAWRLAPLGLLASAVVLWGTRGMTTVSPGRTGGAPPGSWRALLRVMVPLTAIVMTQGFMTVSLSTYLPTFLTSEGRSLWEGGAGFSVIQLAGAVGAFTAGTLSDRVGRRRVLAFLLVAGPVVMGLFLLAPGWALFPMLFVLGLAAFSSNPVMMAIVQEHGRAWPATANGLYMALLFAGRSLIIIAVGALADAWGLRATFQVSALIALCAVLFVWWIPRVRAADSRAMLTTSRGGGTTAA